MSATSNGPATQVVPEIGSIVETLEHGRQQVMDVLDLSDERGRLIYLRPEGGGCEWTVRESGWGQVVGG
ncbi:hypothetical protein [Streptodolium elevatio]|uniref:Uncharacterized protein n=1 Tax=Streptodolium elevatio TaxID=3157996 RepID=A0ABV3DWC9_9ACTN